VSELLRLHLGDRDDSARLLGEPLERPPAATHHPSARGHERALNWTCERLLADDLVYALVADPKLVRDLAQRPAPRMQAPDRVLVIDARALLLVL
jgi:hypothetical protein